MTACRSSRRGSSGSGSSGSGRRLVLAAAAAALVLLALLGGADARPKYSEKRGAKDGYRVATSTSKGSKPASTTKGASSSKEPPKHSGDDDDAASRKEQASSRRHRAKYDGGDGLKGCSAEGSPNPQRPDAYVDNLLLSQGTLVWRDVAVPSAAAAAASLKRANVPREVPFPQYRQRTTEATLGLARNRSMARAAFAARAGAPTRGKRDAAAAAAAAAAEQPVGVTDPSLLLPLVGGGNAVEQTGFYGVADGEFYPSDEALAAGPHPDDPSRALLLHGVNARLELFEAARDGKKLRSFGAVPLLALQFFSGYFNWEIVTPTDPTAFYDLEAERWVVVWVGIGIDSIFGPQPSVNFVAVSSTSDPRGEWTVKTLDVKPRAGTNLEGTCDAPLFIPDYPQTSYNQDGVYITFLYFCGPFLFFEDSMIWALPKRDLYARGGGKVRGAAYTLLRAWAGSFPPDNPLNFVPLIQAAMPVLPQARSDVVGKHKHTAFFVTTGSNISFTEADTSDRLSIGALLNTQRLDTMTGASDAPLVAANVIAKGFTFPAITVALINGVELELPQPNGERGLEPGDVGGIGRMYSSILHNGLIYTSAIEMWGTAQTADTTQVGIYYAVVDPGSKPLLCSEGIEKVAYGFFTGRDGIAVSFPALAVADNGDAIMAFALSGNGSLPDAAGGGPAYAGVGTARITLPRDGADPLSSVPAALTLAKQGQRVIRNPPPNPNNPDEPYLNRWGDYSAVGVHAGQAWFAVSSSSTAALPLGYGSWLTPRNVGQ